MTYNTILYSEQNGITTISLNRPDRYNACTAEMREELLHAMNQASDSEECRVVILTGEGKAFCSGQDLKDIEGQDIDFADFLKRGYNPIILAMRNMKKPIIGKINGVAAGAGCSLALACDFIVADERASFIEVFVGIGLVLDSGSSFFLPRLVGSNRAFEIATLGSKVSATQALEWGMINRAVPTEELNGTVQEIAEKYSKSATYAIGMMKEMLNKSMHSSLEEVLDMEAHFQSKAGSSDDYQEGVAAFVEKRKPNFKGG